MTAHSYSLTLRGKNLKPHTEEEIRKVLNRGQEDWIFGDYGEIYQGKNEITITVESKNVKVRPIFKAISKYLNDIDLVFFYCEPYWNRIGSETWDLDMILWARNKEDRARLWGDARISCYSFEPWKHSQQHVYDKYLAEQCKENGVKFYSLEERHEMDEKNDENPNYEYPEDYDAELYESGLEYPLAFEFQSEIVDDFIKKINGEYYEYIYTAMKVPEGA